MAPFSVRPPVHSTTVSSPWAASTEIACSTLARQDAVENGRTMPVVPRIEMPPMMPSLALVVLRAIFSPSGTEMIIWMPLLGQVDGFADGLGDHRARDRVDGRAAQLQAEARLGDHPHAHAAVQLDSRLVAPAHRRGQPRAVRDVGVVARVLDHDRLGLLAGVRVQASTGNRTRWPDGRPIWTVSWISPVCSAVVAAFAAAAAQVPVVQPVRSACFLTFAVRGRSGSRSSGSSCWVTGPSAPSRFAKLLPGLPVRLAETVEMAWVVQVGPAAAGGQAGPDQDQRVLPELAFLDGGGQVFERGRHDQLVRPGHLVGDDARGIRRVAAGQQFVLQLAGPRGREEQRHRRLVARELGHLLARRHRGLAAAEPGQDHRLGDLRDGQLAPDPRRHRGEAGHPGHDLGVQAEGLTLLELLLDGAPQRGVTGVDAGDS